MINRAWNRSASFRLTHWLKMIRYMTRSYYPCCCINEPVIFSHCVHHKLRTPIPCPVESLLWSWWYCPFKGPCKLWIGFCCLSWPHTVRWFQSRPNFIDLLSREKFADKKYLLSRFLWLPAKPSYKIMHAFWLVVCFIQMWVFWLAWKCLTKIFAEQMLYLTTLWNWPLEMTNLTLALIKARRNGLVT